ncbi:MAG: FMN-binding glutamate synthase family protein [Gammaproteobacteria bacterium]|nr:FMN-binding glutamate synthase family protein [Gammaproteobacteria bacterium]MBQ0838474.1 FMN-binding glutamate synthase family protein [Gammaproteobacteria bacterium]
MNGFELNSLVLMEVLVDFLFFMLGLGVLSIVYMYVVDSRQTKHAVRRNFPVVGRFRYFFEHLGEFFRQYFFAMDREEMPFNRAKRSWVYRAAKNVDGTVAFGSTKDINEPGAVLFVTDPFPTLAEDYAAARAITIGPHCHQPFTTASFFNVSAMSFGAISQPAVSALSRGAAQAGCWINTGEGGLSPQHLEGGGDIVFQIGTAKYGVRNEAGKLDDEKLLAVAAHPEVKMFEIKISQGAKPGKGGILPGIKVTEVIAMTRGIAIGEDSISPNGHADIRNVAQLLNMLAHVRELTGKPVGFKLVVGGTRFFDELCEAIKERGVEQFAPDFITLDSGDGGTGAAPQSLLDSAGLNIRETLPMVSDKLEEYGLRERIRLIAAGKLITPGDVAWALCAGADFVVSARGFMFALGCIQAMQCNKNTCPTGVTTHDKNLQQGLDPTDKANRVASYVANMEKEVGTIAHSCGVREPRQLNRRHARVVTECGQSVPLDVLYHRQAEQNPVFLRSSAQPEKAP